MEKNLLSHLVFQFSSSPENLATEAFCFMLNRSQVAREAFCGLLAHLNIELPHNIRYETQDSGSDGAIPDLVGKDSNGKPVIYGEAKFWAGLTDNQPVTYLHRLDQTGGKALIFLAPGMRFPTLWPELIRRCKDAHFQPFEAVSDIAEIKKATIQGNTTLVLMSWRVVLNALQQALEADGDREMLSDLIQLQGLCARMDDIAFLPIQSEELTSNIASRILQYCDIVDEVTSHLVSEGLASKKGFHATSSRGIYLQYMEMKGNGYSISFSPILWNKYGSTPLWLGITKVIEPGKWGYDPEAREKLMPLEMENPPALFKQDKDNYLYVPLWIPLSVEKPEVIQSILHQIKRVYGLIDNR